MKRKGFTLIELIVVMAIISILVLLGVPKYKEYVKEAHLTKIKVDTSELEKVSSTYYMRNNEWPRLSDIPYSKEQIDAFAQEVYDKTGETVVLEDGGNYYDIDYAKLSNYIKKPKEIVNYILQNPVGNVYYLQGVTEVGENRVEPIEEDPVEEVPVEPIEEGDIIFSGIGAGAFDKNSATSVSVGDSSVITWVGDLTNKVLNINLKGSGSVSTSGVRLYFKDVNNNILSFIELNSNTYVNSIGAVMTTKYFKVVVPEGAVKMTTQLLNYGSIGTIIDIYTEDVLKNPSEVKNVTHISEDYNITLNWEQTDINYERVAIFRDGVLIGFTNGFTYTDSPLLPSKQYTYEIQAFDTAGNASSRITYTASTNIPEITFSGIGAGAFDNDSTTSASVSSSSVITWVGDLTNKVLNITLKGGGSVSTSGVRLYFKDVNNNILSFVEVNSGTTVSSLGAVRSTKYFKAIVPEGAVKITFQLLNSGSTGAVIDMYI